MTRSVRRRVGAGVGALALALLCSCVEIPLSDGMIFVPPSPALQDGGRGFSNEAWIEARQYGPDADYPSITHGFTRLGVAGMSWSEVSLGDAARPLIFYCFGNGSDRFTGGAGAADKMLPFGDAFLFDYPGYGDSGGKTNAETLEKTLPVLIADVRARHPGRKLVYWGQSLGGQVCAEAARLDPETSGYIGEATGPDLDRMAETIRKRITGPFFRVRPNRRQEWLDASASLLNVPFPVLILDAGEDDVIPGELGKELVQRLEGAGHPDVSYRLFPAESHTGVDRDPEFRPFVRAWFAAKIY